MAIRVEKLPIFPQLGRFRTSKYMILNLARWLSYLLRLFGPGAWLMAMFQKKYDTNYYTNSTAAELYQLAATIYPLGVMLVEVRLFRLPMFFAWICIVLLVECMQYQFWNVVVRPACDPEYKRFSNARTLLIIVLQYFQIILIFALIYKDLLPMQFHVSPKADPLSTLLPLQALEFSAITMTTVGYGSIYPEPGSSASLVAASEALCGVFFLGLMLANVLSGMREVKEIPDPS